MRITHKVLLKIAQDTVNERARSDRSLLAAFLTGSCLKEDGFLLGGTADIDLVFIHAEAVAAEREIVGLSEQVHLDIAHHPHQDYRNPRRLRVHPWMGPVIFHCKPLYDPQHFLDFTQASVRGQFNQAEYVVARALRHVEPARQIWLDLSLNAPDAGSKETGGYLRAVAHAVSAVASLGLATLSERRLVQQFAGCAVAVGRPGFYPGLLGLLGAPQVTGEIVRAWLPAWQAAYAALPAGCAPAPLHPARLEYHLRGMEAFLDDGAPEAALWPLLRTWTQAAGALPPEGAEAEAWRGALAQLGLQGEGFAERVAALDAYLDMIEEAIDGWADDHGAVL